MPRSGVRPCGSPAWLPDKIPNYARTLGLLAMKLPFDLVPKSSWGENLRNKLGRSKWDKLRKQVLADQGNRCAICRSTEKLQCHEVWEFNDRSGTQLLRRFQAICSMCHLASHIGLAQKLAAQGHVNLDNVVAHSLRINGIDRQQFEELRIQAFELWRDRSARKWKLELGQWGHLLASK